MEDYLLRARAEIDLGAIRCNYNIAKASGKKVMCVIKGDAHGHGAVKCGRFLESLGADAFAVACLEEALQLRDGGITKPILILGYTPPTPNAVAVIARAGLMQTLLDEEYAQCLDKSARSAGVRVECHIKLDTGMSRLGVYAQGAKAAKEAGVCARRMFDLEGLKVSGIYTHFSAADMPDRAWYVRCQIDNFLTALDALGLDTLPERPLIHMSNSAAIMGCPEARFDMVRAGVMLYGLYPDNLPHPDGPLMPALCLKAPVVQIKELSEGAYVSYGMTYRIPQRTRVAIVAAGYADSYPRALSNTGAWALIGGMRCRQIGRVCMDLTLFDVGSAKVEVGDDVILYGAGGMSLEEAAQLSDTINCAITSTLTNRVKRIYRGGNSYIQDD